MRWPPAVDRLAVMRCSALGDVVLCEPAVDALRQRYPAAHLTVVTREPYHDLYRAHPAVDQVLTPESLGRVDLLVDLQNKLRTRLVALRASRALHWRKRQGPALWRGLLGRPLHRGYRSGPHQLERIEAWLGLPLRRAPRIHLRPEWVREAAALVPSGTLVLLPAASREVKAWGAQRFATVAGAWPGAVRVIGGPGEAALLRTVARCSDEALPTELRLGVVAACLARAAAIVGNDSGLTHLASAVGAPVVALFGPTPPGRWGPPPGLGEVVALDLPCAPCSDHGARECRLERRACLDDLTPERVLNTARKLCGDRANVAVAGRGPKP